MAETDTRQRILQAAVVLMGQSGVRGVSAAALARAAGISKATLFHHFARMDEIPVEAFELLTAKALALDLPEKATLTDALLALGANALNLHPDQRPFVRAYFAFSTQALNDGVLRKKVAGSMIRAQADIASRLRPYLADPGQAPILASVVLAALDGAMLQQMMLDAPAGAHTGWPRVASALSREFGS